MDEQKSRQHLALPVLVLVAAALIGLPARAEEPAPVSLGQVESHALTGWIGRFQPKSREPAAEKDGIAFGVGWERRLQSGLRYGIEANFYYADYRLPAGTSCGLFCVVNETMSMDIMGIGPKVGYGTTLGRLDLYAGAGLGFYFSTLTASGATFGIPAEHEEKDSDLGADVDANARASSSLSERRSTRPSASGPRNGIIGERWK